ncbi:sys1 golgi trafficking protein [Arctopsyche grandis]|uniref:sys1 golgi trafficking protein n=1 Tax=Arctopsyche grandis TaxID=121162 RepID=UPI00406D8FFF
MKKLTGSFRYTQWDPILLVSQITAMQSVLYVSLGILIAVMQDISSSTRTLDHIFKYHEIHIRNFEGQMVIVAFVINALVGGYVLWFVVQRTKLCLDFSCTFYCLHLICCWYYNGNFPSTFSWWALNIACASITCVTGEFMCLKSELKAIPLGMGAKVDL